MPTYVNPWKEPSGRTVYMITGKEADPLGDKIDLACWFLQGEMSESLSGSGTVGDIYYQITRPMGMSLDETKALVKECKKRGYLR